MSANLKTGGDLVVTARSVLASAALCAVAAGTLTLPATEADEVGTGGVFVPVTYSRLFDTKWSGSTAFGPDEQRDYLILGKNGVPSSGVSAVLVDIAATSATSANSAAQLWPTGQPRPSVSQLRYGSENVPRSNTVAVAVGAGGKISLHNDWGTTDFNLDVQGYFTGTGDSSLAPGGFVPLTPTRVVNSETGLAVPQQKLAPGATVRVSLAGQGGISSDASGVFANVGANNSTADGTLVIVPAGAPTTAPAALNYSVGGRERSGVNIPLAGGSADIKNTGSAAVDITIDAQGYFSPDPTAGGGFHVVEPSPLLDTTNEVPLAPNEEINVLVGGVGGVPGRDAAAMMSVIALNYTHTGGIVVRNVDGPSSSLPSVTFDNTETAPNSATSVVTISRYGEIAVRNTSNGSVDVRIHLQGWFGLPAAENPAPTPTGPLASGLLLAPDGSPAANVEVKLASLVPTQDGRVIEAQMLGTTMTDSSGNWEIPRPAAVTPIHQLEVIARVDDSPVIHDYVVEENLTTATAPTQTVVLKAGVGEVFPVTGGGGYARLAPGAYGSDGSFTDSDTPVEPDVAVDITGPADAPTSFPEEPETVDTQAAYAKADTWDLVDKYNCWYPMWVARDKYKRVMVPIRGSETRNHSTLRYAWTTTELTRLEVGISTKVVFIGGGLSESTENETGLTVEWDWPSWTKKMGKIAWKYRLYRAYCAVPEDPFDDEPFWMNYWKWQPHELDGYNNATYFKPDFACDSQGSINGLTTMDERTSVTWRKWFEISWSPPKTGVTLGGGMDNRQTQTDKTALIIDPDTGETARYCGSGDTLRNSAKVREIKKLNE